MSSIDDQAVRDGLLAAARRRHEEWYADENSIPTDAERDRAGLLAELDRMIAERDRLRDGIGVHRDALARLVGANAKEPERTEAWQAARDLLAADVGTSTDMSTQASHTFHTPKESDLRSHDGQRVIVLRALSPNEVTTRRPHGLPCPMYEVEFPDGLRHHAFLDELSPPPTARLATMAAREAVRELLRKHAVGVRVCDECFYSGLRADHAECHVAEFIGQGP